MLTIRFARVGKKNKAQYRIVLQEHTVAPGGRHVEVLGSYDPHFKKAVIKEDRVDYWISQGAQVSDTAYNLFVSQGIIKEEKRKIKITTKKKKKGGEEEIKEKEGEAKENDTKKQEESEPKEEAKKDEVKEEAKPEEPKKEKAEVKEGPKKE